MSGSRSLEVGSTSDNKCVESFQVAHHFVAHIENRFILQFLDPLFASRNPIAQSLEESYVASTVAK